MITNPLRTAASTDLVLLAAAWTTARAVAEVKRKHPHWITMWRCHRRRDRSKTSVDTVQPLTRKMTVTVEYCTTVFRSC